MFPTHYWKMPDGTFYEIHCGDCRGTIANNLRDWYGRFDFAFIDPPFNIGEEYDAHHDKMPAGEFGPFIYEAMYSHQMLLRHNGIFVIHVPDDMVEMVLRNAYALHLQRIDWVIWHYRFGQCQRGKFISSKAHGLVFRNGSGPHTWDADNVLVESDRATKYNDARINDSVNGGSRVPFDVWGEFPRLQGNNAERSQFPEPHPNQLPELYVARYIKAYTNPGDFCIDGFGGHGTTITVCKALNRSCVTIEKSPAYCGDIVTRFQKGAVRL